MSHKIVSRGSSHLLLCLLPCLRFIFLRRTRKRERRKYKDPPPNGRPLFVAKLLGKIGSRGTPVPSLPGVPPSLASYRMGARFCKFPCLSLPRLLAQSRLRHHRHQGHPRIPVGCPTENNDLLPLPSNLACLVPTFARYLAERKERTDSGQGRGARKARCPVIVRLIE